MTCNFSFLRGCFARSRFLKPNDKKSYEKHLITIDHKHNLCINFRLVRITYFHNATVIKNLPPWFNRSFSTSFHFAFRLIYQVAFIHPQE